MNISLRIKQLIERLELTKNSFSKAIGLENNVTIGRIINEDRNPSYEVLEKILQTFGNVDANWLMKGEGEMFKNVNLNVNPPVNPKGKKTELKVVSDNHLDVAQLVHELQERLSIVEGKLYKGGHKLKP